MHNTTGLGRAVLACALAAPLSNSALGQGAFGTYGKWWEVIDMPAIGAGSFDVKGDALPDGRIVAVTGLEVLVETAPGSRVFEVAGVLDGAALGGATDPAFLSVSPSGTRVAIGAGFAKPVVVFEASVLDAGSPANLGDGVGATRYHSVEHFDGAWYDDARLAVTAGAFGQPSRVDLLDVGAPAPSLATVVANIGGTSGGIAFDASGRLYTGNGFDLGAGGSDTGWIKAFEFGDWSGGAPADFEAAGTLVADVLSAGSLRFDREGNLLVGGGDFASGDVGYAGVIEGGALADALGGAGAIDPGDPAHLSRLEPFGASFSFFGTAYDGVSGTVFVTDGATWYATVPAPSAWMTAGVTGALCMRRRR